MPPNKYSKKFTYIKYHYALTSKHARAKLWNYVLLISPEFAAACRSHTHIYVMGASKEFTNERIRSLTIPAEVEEVTLVYSTPVLSGLETIGQEREAFINISSPIRLPKANM